MPEETFDQNFTWYEWTFVSPEDLHREEPRAVADKVPAGWDTLEVWDEDHRWPT